MEIATGADTTTVIGTDIMMVHTGEEIITITTPIIMEMELMDIEIMYHLIETEQTELTIRTVIPDQE